MDMNVVDLSYGGFWVGKPHRLQAEAKSTSFGLPEYVEVSGFLTEGAVVWLSLSAPDTILSVIRTGESSIFRPYGSG